MAGRDPKVAGAWTAAERAVKRGMAYFDRCEYCGAALDPGERCDCRKARAETKENGMTPVAGARWGNRKREPARPMRIEPAH